jgi:hypothetical protein
VVSDAVDDGRLLMAAARGEQAAFEAFYRRWLPQVVGFHLRRVGVPEVAFDLTAETFAAVVSGGSIPSAVRPPAGCLRSLSTSWPTACAARASSHRRGHGSVLSASSSKMRISRALTISRHSPIASG